MNAYFKKILLLVMVILSAPMLEGIVSNVVAATPTRSVRGMESEKAKKKKAADKKRQQKQKAREKQRRKAALAKQKAAKKKQSNTPPRKEERNEQADYQEEVARIKAYNQRVIKAQQRDLTHSLGIMGYMGYSNIFQNFGPKVGIGVQSKGGFGGAGAVGYQLRYQHFLFNTGVEYEVFNSATRIFNNEAETYTESYNVQQYPSMHYNYEFNKLTDHWSAGYLNVPLLFGGEFDRYYFLVGPKIGINLMGTSQYTHEMTTTITDDKLIGEFSDMPTHAIANNQPFEGETKTFKFNYNLALHAEAGIYLDEWFHPQIKKGMSKQQKDRVKLAERFSYRLGVFADYGVLNTYADNGLYMDKMMEINATNPLDVTVNSLLAHSQIKETGALHPFMVGVKLAIFYNIPKKEQKLLSLPPEPLPRMAIKVIHEQTGTPLSGAVLSIYDPIKDKTFTKTTGKTGLVVQKRSRGEYQLYAERAGYIHSDTILVNHQSDLLDTIRIPLRPEPNPIVYTLCAYVQDAESKALIGNAQVTISQAEHALFTGATNEDGLFVTNLLKGDYIAHVTASGYMPQDDSISFIQDTLYLFINKIQEGKKIRINNLFFATNKTIILPESEAAMEDLTIFLSENPTVKIHIVGHTDAVGSATANQRLSEGRANAVRSDLIMRGIDPDRLTAEGKGESEPIATNDTEEGRALNRRVEFTITTTGNLDIEQIWSNSESGSE